MIKNLIFIEALVILGYAFFFLCLRRAEQREVQLKPFIIFSALPAIAFLSPSLLLVHLCYFFLIPLLARTREEVGLAIVTSLIAMPALQVTPAMAGVSLFDYSVHTTIALGGLCKLLMTKRRGPGLRIRDDIPALAIMALIFFIAVRDTTPTHWLRSAIAIAASLALPYYLVRLSITSHESLRKLCVWLAGAACMLSAIVAYEAIASWPLYHALNEKFHIYTGALVIKFRFGLMRAEGPLLEATQMGFVLMVGLGATLASRKAFKSGFHYLLLLAVIGLGLVAPQSRGAWVGAAVVVMTAALYNARRITPGRWMIPVVAAVALAMAASEWLRTTGETSETVDYRNRLFERGLEEFWASPWVGSSTGAVSARMQDLVQGEGIIDFVNAYLYFALLTGAVGLFGFALALTAPMLRLWRGRSRFVAAPVERGTAAFLFSMLAAILVMLLFASFWGQLASLSVLLIGLASVARRQPATASPAPSKKRRMLTDRGAIGGAPDLVPGYAAGSVDGGLDSPPAVTR